MNINVNDLKESNDFLNLLFENLTSGIFLTNNEFKLKNVNSSVGVIFDKEDDALIGKRCGEALGCSFTVDHNMACGTTPYCSECILRNNVMESFTEKSNIIKTDLHRKFYIGENKIEKYFQFTTKYLNFNEVEYVVVILDDVTEIEIQKNILKEKEKETSESIRYAKRIQQNILPHEDILNSFSLENFIIYLPKDIVSGDFYWIFKIKDFVYCAVADCTGHGVPGALMSMMGTSFLNEIISKMGVTKPSIILDHLRDLIIMGMKQEGRANELKDGMDISLILFNVVTKECQFAGANNSLYIIRKNQKHPVLEEIFADKMPISFFEQMTPFTNHSIQLQGGDQLYFCTDGYQDQFGGPNNKRFSSKRLKNTLVATNHLSMSEQKEMLLKTLLEWMGTEEQIDDICLMGIRLV